MFSVIIPLYNKANYVLKAVDSVLQQTYTEFELIIVNDGSTDNSLEIVNKIKDKRVRVIDQLNTGVSVARNNGVAAAECDYIAFLDADDWWEPSYLQEMKKLISAYPKAGIYGCAYYIVKNGQKRIAPIGVESGFSSGIINYFQVYAKTLCMPLCTGSVILKKSVFESEMGFKSNLKLGEDFDLWVRVALKHPVAFLNRLLAYYNQDVDIESKAVVNDKIYPTENHFIFNLDYLINDERNNIDLKILLDKLRVYTLYRYRLQRKYKEEVQREIDKVNFLSLSNKEIQKYKLPIPLLSLQIKIKRLIIKYIINLY